MRAHFAYACGDRSEQNDLRPHLKQTWCIAQIDARFLAQMEQLLALYAQPYDPHYPVVCFDERPCFLIGEVLAPRSFQAGHIVKEHYAYDKKGSCALFGAFEPLTGVRLAAVYPQRTMLEYTQFCQALVAHWPEAHKIRLVQDNLNTHHTSAFTGRRGLCLSAEVRVRLYAQRGQLVEYD